MDSMPVSSQSQVSSTKAQSNTSEASDKTANPEKKDIFSTLLRKIQGGNNLPKEGNALPLEGKAANADTLQSFAPVNKIGLEQTEHAEELAPFFAPLSSTLQQTEELSETPNLASDIVESMQVSSPDIGDESSLNALSAFAPVGKIALDTDTSAELDVNTEVTSRKPAQAHIASLQINALSQRIGAGADINATAPGLGDVNLEMDPPADAMVNATYITRPLPQTKPAIKTPTIAKAEVIPQPMGLSQRYMESDSVARQKIFEAEWTNAQAITPNTYAGRTGIEPTALSQPNSAIPEDGLPPFVSTLTATTGPLSSATTLQGLNGAAPSAPQTVPLAQRGWEKSMASNVSYMVRENMRSLQVKVNPADLGPINIELSMEDDKLKLNIQASQSLTRDMLEQAAPRLRELLADAEQHAEVDVNVSDHNPQQAQQDSQNAESTHSSASQLNGKNDAMSDDETATEVLQTSQVGLVDLFA